MLRAVPIYAMIAESLPPWARKEIDCICRKFFWAGTDSSIRGKCMVTWPTVCKPTDLGGLGIIDLKLAGIALQSKWLWLQKVDRDRAWSQLPIRTSPEVQAFFRASTYTYTVVGDRPQALFWEDRWINGDSASDIAPCLCQLVPRRTRNRLTVRDGLTDRAWTRTITGGMSADAISEYLFLWNTLRDFQLTEVEDKTIWRWTPDGSYSAKSAYSMLHTGSTPFLGHKLIWKTWAPLKIKIFPWLAFRRRHWTGDRRRRHGLDAHEACYLCDQGLESIDHILAQCPVTREIWHHVLTALGRQCPQAAPTTLRWWRRVRSLFHGDQRAGCDSLFALISWEIWKERNARSFRDSAATMTELLQVIKAIADRWIEAGAVGHLDYGR